MKIENNTNKTIERIFIPQRTQPPHIGHLSLLEAACNKSKEVIIGIGSSNVIDEKNPYTAAERELMLRKSLEDKHITNYRIVYVPDFPKDEDWMRYMEQTAKLDNQTKVVTGNDYVDNLFRKKGYAVLTLQEVIPGDLYDISATKLREMIVTDNPAWKNYAASGTLEYFDKFGGKDRLLKVRKNN